VVKVLSLFSGSLASRVATKLVERHPQVRSIQLLHFRSPFSHECDDLRQLVKAEWPRSIFRTQSIKKDYQDLITLTAEGEFSLAESCRSCQSLLLSKAARYMERVGADYVVSGAIPGKHGRAPRSECGGDVEYLSGRILSPLLMRQPLKIPIDVSSWADKKRQTRDPGTIDGLVHRLASELGLNPIDPVCSEHRCKLTAPGFGERVAALFREEVVTLNALCLLDFPLYFRAHPDLRIVLACNENEKRELQNYFLPQDLRLYPATPHGPMTLLRTDWEGKGDTEKNQIIEFVAKLTATYADASEATSVPIYYRLECEDERQLINVEPFDSIEELEQRADLELVPLRLPAQLVYGA